MTDIQRGLLDLLIEIDDICRKYGIEYYLAGGTLVGAVRHGGFLPWDDDADIHMTRENGYKFLEAMKKEKPENRVLELPSMNHNMNPHWRYKCTDNTVLMRGNIGVDTVEGQFVDIFVNYPMPVNPKKRDRCVDDYKVYIELNAPNGVFESKKSHHYLRKYYRARMLGNLIGQDRVTRALGKRIFNYSDEGSEEYLIGSPLPPKFTVVKSWWSKPRYVKFENIQLPVPEYAEKFLNYIYGVNWFEIPVQKERREHIFVVDMELPYTVYTADYNRHFNVERFYAQEVKKKDFWFKLLWDRNVIMPQIRGLQGLSAALEIQQAVRDCGIDLKELIEQGREQELKQIFAPYFQKINSEPSRYHNVYVDMPDEYLYAALYFQCYNGNYSVARRVLGLRRSVVARTISADLQRLCDLCDATDQLLDILYGECDLQSARDVVDEWLEKEPKALYFLRADVFLRLNRFGKESTEELLNRCDRYLEWYVDDGELLKYRGDLLFKIGKKEEGERCYRKALCTLRNGLCIKAINEYFESVEEKAIY